MASTYTTSLQIQKIGTGEQSGVWGSTTNTNWELIEQAVAGVQNITMVNADYTLTVLNGTSDEARNAVLVVSGTNSAVRKIVIPSVSKMYMVVNNTSGGYAVTVGTSGGAVATVPNGVATFVYCDATNTYSGVTGSSGNFTVGGNETVSGNLAVTGTTTLTGDATATTQPAGTLNAKLATTAFVGTAIANLSLGTMATQNANAVAVTGGSITGITDLAVADGGTGSSTLAANAVLLGNGTSAIQTVAPGTSGNVLVSNGTTWTSGAGFGWNVTYVNTSVSSGGSYSLPANCVGVYVWCTVYGGGNNGGIGKADILNGGTTLGTVYINGTNIGGGADGGSGMTDGAGSFIPVPSTATSLTLTIFNNAVSGSFIVQAYVTSA